ncbi:MAG: methyltransferase domain-containing protein [Rhodospirillales bacterium]|nr:methyltransferase domain-containing protein [Rhodospirillales bacterium]
MVDVEALLNAEFNKFCLRHEPDHFRPLVRLIAGLFPLEGRCVMDFGCGTGDLGLALIAAGAQELIGLDISKPAIAAARQKAQGIAAATFYCQDIVSQPWEGRSVHLLVSHSAVHYIGRPFEDILRRLAKLVLPGGHLFLTVEADDGSRWINRLQRFNLRFLPEWLRARLYRVLLLAMTFKSGSKQGLEDPDILRAKSRYLAIPVLHRMSGDALRAAAHAAYLTDIDIGTVPSMNPLQTPHLYLAARVPLAAER